MKGFQPSRCGTAPDSVEIMECGCQEAADRVTGPAAALTLAASTSPGLVIVDLGDLAQREQQHRRNQAGASAGRATPQIAERQTRMREKPE
jgi:hypothetical protein